MIRTQGVTGEFFSARTKARSVKNADGAYDFEAVLKKESVGASELKMEEAADSFGEHEAVEKTDKMDQETDVTDVTNQQNTEVSAADKKQENDSFSEQDECKDLEMPEELAAETVATLNHMFENIVQMISEYTGKSVEEIKGMMEMLDMGSQDLLETSKLNQLVANLLDKTNVMQLLTDSDLSSMVKELTVAVNGEKQNVLGQLQMRDTDVAQFLEQVQADEQSNVDITDKNLAQDKFSQDVNFQSGIQTEKTEQNEQTFGESNFTGSEEYAKTRDWMTQGTSSQKESDVKERSAEFSIGMTGVMEHLKVAVEDILPEENRNTLVNRIMSQITDSIRTQATPDMKSLELQLEPENLGKVTISLVSKAGHVTAEIAAQTQVAKEAIESQLMILKENLQQQGIKVDSIEVTIASHGFEQNLEKGNESNTGSQSGRRQRRMFVDDGDDSTRFMDEPENLDEAVLEDLGANVSYLA